MPLNKFKIKRKIAIAIGAPLGAMNSRLLSGHRVLSFHSVGSPVDGDIHGLYDMPAKQFAEHIAQLVELVKAYAQLKPTRLAAGLSEGTSISFDDGYANTLTTAAPILARAGLPFQVFVSPGLMQGGDRRYLTTQQLVELSKMDGVTIGAHGFEHSKLTELRGKSLLYSLVDARKFIEDAIQIPVTSMSYPFGATSREVSLAAKDAGYELAMCSMWGFNKPSTSKYQLRRLDMWCGDSNAVFAAKLHGGWNWMRLTQPSWMRSL